MSEITTRKRNLFDPSAPSPYKLSRSKLEYFLQCPRCFYLDRRLGVERPESPPYNLNNAVDTLMKREFDLSRAASEQHPIMKLYGIDAMPLQHPDLNSWREIQSGIRHLHAPTNFLFFGAVDDVWTDSKGNWMIVDYKATSTPLELTSDYEARGSYKRQLEMYQWLFRQNGFPVSRTGYFVFVNADKGRDTFDGRLEFATTLITYNGNDDWVDDALKEAKTCLLKETLPQPHPNCEWCEYRRNAASKEIAPL